MVPPRQMRGQHLPALLRPERRRRMAFRVLGLMAVSCGFPLGGDTAMSPKIGIPEVMCALVGLTGGAWFAWYALETGNSLVLLIVLVFFIAGLVDLVRRLRKMSR